MLVDLLTSHEVTITIVSICINVYGTLQALVVRYYGDSGGQMPMSDVYGFFVYYYIDSREWNLFYHIGF